MKIKEPYRITPTTFCEAEVNSLIDPDGETFYPISDICDILEFADHNKVASRYVAEENKRTAPRKVNGKLKRIIVINEEALVRLLFKSKNFQAQLTVNHIFKTVLPTIKAKGYYVKDWSKLKADMYGYDEED